MRFNCKITNYDLNKILSVARCKDTTLKYRILTRMSIIYKFGDTKFSILNGKL